MKEYNELIGFIYTDTCCCPAATAAYISSRSLYLWKCCLTCVLELEEPVTCIPCVQGRFGSEGNALIVRFGFAVIVETTQHLPKKAAYL